MRFRNDTAFRTESSTLRANEPGRGSGSERYAYVNAVRGWAILMVVTAHVGGRFPELPYPAKKLTNFGWNGVQLFFLASAVTLALSWHASALPFGRKTSAFFVRRYLRIAPMYYLGAALYTVADPPASGIHVAQLLRSLLFVNAWNPEWISTTGGWIVVPGGWSISVEFTFYAVFPALISLVTTLRRGLLFAFATLLVAAASSVVGEWQFAQYSTIARSNFLYFWFPDQLPVFAIGLVLYFLLLRTSEVRLTPATSTASFCAIGVAAIALAEYPMASDRFTSGFAIPQVLAATLIGAAFIFTLARARSTVLAHPVVQRLGVLSFSGYVLHFLFVGKIPAWSGGLIDIQADGYSAIVSAALLWCLVVMATFLLAEVTHRCIEQPGIDLARRLTRRRIAMPVPAI